MKIDMHCHTKEGSIDAKLGIVEYALMLNELGFNGMLITDHNSFKGYNYWKKLSNKPKELSHFVILKGIEYDTKDGGHVICIMPDGSSSPYLEKRGMSLNKLEQLVHENGGLIGAAHPYGFGYFAITNTKLYKKNPNIINIFDFIESYNSGIEPDNNNMAKDLAQRINKPETSGSDAHSAIRVGTAYTVFNEDIQCNDDLIEVLKACSPTEAIGEFYKKLLKRRKKFIKVLGIAAYWIYNKSGVIIFKHSRTKALKEHFNKKNTKQ